MAALLAGPQPHRNTVAQRPDTTPSPLASVGSNESSAGERKRLASATRTPPYRLRLVGLQSAPFVAGIASRRDTDCSGVKARWTSERSTRPSCWLATSADLGACIRGKMDASQCGELPGQFIGNCLLAPAASYSGKSRKCNTHEHDATRFRNQRVRPRTEIGEDLLGRARFIVNPELVHRS